MPDTSSPPLIYIVAGEPSGDLLGAQLMAALKAKTGGPISGGPNSGGGVRFTGVGGPRMAEQGLESLFPMSDLAVMGFVEVVRHIPNVKRRIGEVVADIQARAPDAVVTVDAPAFTLRVQRKLRAAMGGTSENGAPRLIHFVAPTVWAWRKGRAKEVAEFLDHLLCILPFEPPYFEKHGLKATFVGYPAIEDAVGGDGAAFRRENDIPAGAPMLCLMPGSRRSEIGRLLPIFLKTLDRLEADHPGLRAAIPVVPNVRDLVEAMTAGDGRITLLHDPTRRKHLFAAADAALIKVGTANLELAAAGVPLVSTQRVSHLSGLIYQLLVRMKYISLINIVLDRETHPEPLQYNCTPRNLARLVGGILDDESVRRAQIEAGLEAARRVGLGGPSPSDQAADVVLAELVRSGAR